MIELEEKKIKGSYMRQKKRKGTENIETDYQIQHMKQEAQYPPAEESRSGEQRQKKREEM